MRGIVLLALVAAVALAAIDGGERRHHRRHYTDEDEPVRSSSRLRSSDRRNLKEKIDQAWADYKEQFDKSYDEDEESDFMNAFVRNVVHIEEHNKQHRQGTKSFEIGINHLADLPMHKFKKLNGFRGTRGSSMVPKESSNASSWVAPFNVVAPLTVDWREKELVTPVKNQGMCGSCWAFSATGALEGQHAKQTGKLVSLSEQNLVDCSRADQGCDGGLMDNAFQYIRDNHGIDTEESYPYKGRANKCHFNKRTVGADDTGFVDLRSGDEEGLKLAIATVGPISVAIDAGHRSFQLYKKGVYYEQECSSEELDHGVLLVGYGTDPEGGDYWLIKNSWGEGWGEKGYIRIARNKDNHCGVATIASYPLV